MTSLLRWPRKNKHRNTQTKKHFMIMQRYEIVVERPLQQISLEINTSYILCLNITVLVMMVRSWCYCLGYRWYQRWANSVLITEYKYEYYWAFQKWQITNWKFGHKVTVLAFVKNLVFRWHHFYWFQIWPTGGDTCRHTSYLSVTPVTAWV